MHTVNEDIPWYYAGPERRHASRPRREHGDRRYRLRNEALISDFRQGMARRQEDTDGFVEISGLYNGTGNTRP